MGKQPSPAERTPTNAGTGQVTPIQIAFVVDRYLADNGYTATLASFRSEASAHFSKPRNRKSSKRLLSLGEILDDYVKLKEQRIVMDREKQRVEALLRGIHNAVQAYHSVGVEEGGATAPALPHCLPSPSTPHPPSPLEVPLRPIASGFLPCVTRQFPSTVSATSGNPLLETQSPIFPASVAHHSTVSTPVAHAASILQNQNPKTIPRVPSAPKKYRARSQAIATTSGDVPATPTCDGESGQGESAEPLPPVGTASPGCQRGTPSIHASSSVAKILFSQPPESASPETPHETAPPSCSVISSKSVHVSPFKTEGCHVEQRLSKRVNAKGRLDFDGSEDGPQEDIFDFDLQDLDLDLNFSDLLVNLDFDCDDIAEPSANLVPGFDQGEPGQQPSEMVDHGEPGQQSAEMVDQGGHVDQSSMESRLKSMNTHPPEGGDDSGAVTATRGITKRIKLSSPNSD